MKHFCPFFSVEFLVKLDITSTGLCSLHGKRKVFACGEYKMEVLLKVVQLVELVEALPFRLVVVSSCAMKVQEN